MDSRLRSLLVCLFLLPSAVLIAQRPKTAEQALERYEKVRGDNEATRRRSVGDLGPFAEAAVTRVLLAELARSESDSFRQVIVRALGGTARPEPDGVLAALQAVLQNAENPRLCDQAGKSIAAQGDAGVAWLGTLLDDASNQSDKNKVQRTAACRGLEEVVTDAARSVLMAGVERASDRNRMAPFEALRRHGSTPLLDKLRVALASDKDYLIAAEAIDQLARHQHREVSKLALQLSRRLTAKARAKQHAAILHGLLRQPDPSRVEPKHYEAILQHATLAQAPFDARLAPLWTAVLGDTEFAAFACGKGTRHKDAARRRVAALALAFVPEAGRELATQALTNLLTDRDDEVIGSAASSLAQYGRKFAMPPLLALVAAGNDAGKTAAAEAIHVMCHDDGGWHGLLLGHSQDRSAALSATALRLLARCGGGEKDKSFDVAVKGLQHKAWPVRAAAIELLTVLRMAQGIPFLIERFDQEKARMHADVLLALEELTQQRFADKAAWQAWWQREGARFTVPAVDPKRKRSDRKQSDTTVATYWDLPVHSDRVAFVVDASGSMKAPFGTGGTRLAEAQRQLRAVLEKLPNKAKANIIAFHDEASAWADNLQRLSVQRQKLGIAFADKFEARYGTNVHGGLRLAFADPEVDTIFLLTDGRPSAGEIIDSKALAAEVARWNVGRGIRIHTVAIGETSRLLEQLAKESGGNYTVAR